MDLITAKLILAMARIWIIQDGLASFWFYNNREGRFNQMVRIIRIGWGVVVIVIAVSLV